jgi:hypothetical protein
MRVGTLRWSAAARAASYEVRYSTAKNFAAATKFAEEPTTPSVTVTGLADGTAYNFWVVAKPAGGSAPESAMHTAVKTSDDIPNFLKARLVPDGPVVRYSAGDYYIIQDRGEEYPMHERYYFAYTYFGETPGTIKYVRKFANPPEEPSVGIAWDGGILYDLDWDINRGVIIYEVTNNQGQKQFQAVYYADEHVEPRSHSGCRAPEAVMGNAAGGSLTLQKSDSLDEAIAKFAKLGGPGETDGRYVYFFMMQTYYSYQDPSEYANRSSLQSALERPGVLPGP